MNFRILATLDVNGHGGYCTGNCCEISSEIIDHFFKVENDDISEEEMEALKEMQFGCDMKKDPVTDELWFELEIHDEEENELKSEILFIKRYIPLSDVKYLMEQGSLYCSNSKKSEKLHFKRHEFRCTIQKVFLCYQ